MLYGTENGAIISEDVPSFTAHPLTNAIELQRVKATIAGRAKRLKCFNEELFCDPAWDMLLHLYEANLSQRRISVTAVCIASGAPSSTALRWLQKLLHDGLASRLDDPRDQRRTWVELTPVGKAAMTSYFNSGS